MIWRIKFQWYLITVIDNNIFSCLTESVRFQYSHITDATVHTRSSRGRQPTITGIYHNGHWEFWGGGLMNYVPCLDFSDPHSKPQQDSAFNTGINIFLVYQDFLVFPNRSGLVTLYPPRQLAMDLEPTLIFSIRFFSCTNILTFFQEDPHHCHIGYW